jgi:serine---pyruvate transaminase
VPEKTYLITPGPTPVPPEVEAALARPVLHHRSPEFRALFAETLAGLRRVFATDHDVLLIPGSGTYAMESAVANLLSAGDAALVASAGNFGERWLKLVRAYGVDPVLVEQAWGERLDPGRIAAASAGSEVVFLTHSETSTGCVHDVRAVVEALRAAGSDAVVVVDAVSSLGGIELATDEWGIDVVVSGSQKALMTPPGLAFVAVSPRAMIRAEASTSPRFSFDWRRIAEAQAKDGTPFTPPVTLVAGLNEAIRLIERDGYETAWARNRTLARATREGVKALGLELFSPDDESSAMVTAVRMPEGIDGQEVYTVLRDRHGVVLAGGQGPLRGLIIRIGHMGFMNRFDILTALAALELALGELGYRPPSPGAGVARATALFGEESVRV